MPEPIYPTLVMPDGVERRTVTIWSNGIGLDGEVFRPTAIADGVALPAVVLCHGWGGSKATGERYAALFAEAGMIALTFTQSSWFGSGAPVQLVDDVPELGDNNEATVRVRFIRNLVDPVAWTTNLQAALSFIEGEPSVDPDRIGVWGTSFGGGVATDVAARDTRVKVLCMQVPALSLARSPLADHARQQSIAAARGMVSAIPRGGVQVPGMEGTAYFATLAQFDPISLVDHLRIPTLIIDAGAEELFPTVQNGRAAADILAALSGGVVDYHVIPDITHYGIYFDGYEFGSNAARDWFGRYL